MAATVFLTLAFAALCRAAESVSGAANAESGAARRKSGAGGEAEKISAAPAGTAEAASVLRAAVAVFGSVAAGAQFAELYGAGFGAVCAFSGATALAFAAFSEILPRILAPFFRAPTRLRLRRPFAGLAAAVPFPKLAEKFSGSDIGARQRDTGDDDYWSLPAPKASAYRPPSLQGHSLDTVPVETDTAAEPVTEPIPKRDEQTAQREKERAPSRHRFRTRRLN